MNFITYATQKFAGNADFFYRFKIVKGAVKFCKEHEHSTIEVDEIARTFVPVFLNEIPTTPITFDEFLRNYCNIDNNTYNSHDNLISISNEDKGLFNNFVSINSQFIH